MSQALRNGLFAGGVILPLVLLFWPYAAWGGLLSLLLRAIPMAVLQYLFCRSTKRPWLEAAPLLAAAALAAWGTWLFWTSDHWSHATAWNLLLDYCSPAMAAGAVWALRGSRLRIKSLIKPLR